MNKIYLLFFLLAPTLVFAQDDTYTGDPIYRKKKAEDVKCKYLTETKDKFTGTTHILSWTTRPVIFAKSILKDGTVMMTIYVQGSGSKPILSSVPVKILLDDGTIIERKKARVNTDVNFYSSLTYSYSAAISLTEAEIVLLMDRLITDYRIEYNDTELPTRQRIFAREAAICIYNQKDKPNYALPDE